MSRDRILSIVDRLSGDELTVLLTVAEGLLRGRDVYGELTVAEDRRDFRREAGEELRDALVYLGAAMVRLGLAPKAAAPEPSLGSVTGAHRPAASGRPRGLGPDGV